MAMSRSHERPKGGDALRLGR